MRGVDGQTIAGNTLLAKYINLVKLPHTVFALPFALVGVVYASQAAAVTVVDVGLVLVAFTAARFAAMAFNRLVDHRFDALNVRTRDREIPTGRVSASQSTAAVAAGAIVFVAAASLLNYVCLLLSPLALLWILAYSFTKRFSSWTHLWLGASLAIAPVGGYLAITGAWSTPWWPLAALACSVLTWVAGFDIFYALQDEEFDRAAGLHSAVVLLGQRRSILIAKLLHGITLVGLVAFGLGASLGTLFYIAVAVAAGLLAWEHSLVRPGDTSKLDAAFFQMNGVISIVVFLGVLADRLG